MGFAIPLQPLFHGSVIWRGIVYTILMALGKCATSVWLFLYPPVSKYLGRFQIKIKVGSSESEKTSNPAPSPANPTAPTLDSTQMPSTSNAISDYHFSTDNGIEMIPPAEHRDPPSEKGYQEQIPETTPQYPRTRYAAFLLSFAMTVRGEIGFLIAAVGQGINILVPEEVYLVVIWAVILCTLLGSIGVGFVVYIIKRKGMSGGSAIELLGVWG